MSNYDYESPLRSLKKTGGLTPRERAEIDARTQGNFEKAFRTTALSDSYGQASEDLLRARATGDEAAAYEAEYNRNILREQMAGGAPTGSQTFSEAQESGDWGNFVENTLGSGVASMAPSTLGGVIGSFIPGGKKVKLASGIAGASIPSYQQISNAEAAGMVDDPELAQAVGDEREQLRHIRNKSLVQTLPEALLPGAVGAAARRAGPLAHPNRMLKAAGGAVEEGLTEAGQSYISQKADQHYLPDREIDRQELIDNAVAGAMIGGPMAGGAGGIDVEGGGRTPTNRTDGIPLGREADPTGPVPTPDGGVVREGANADGSIPLGDPNDSGIMDKAKGFVDKVRKTPASAYKEKMQNAYNKAKESPLAQRAMGEAELTYNAVRNDPRVAPRVDAAKDIYETEVKPRYESGKEYVKNTVQRLDDAELNGEITSLRDVYDIVRGNDIEADAESLMTPETEDPSVLGADNVGEALRKRDDVAAQSTMRIADVLMNDPAVSDDVKARIDSFGGDFSSNEAKMFLGTQGLKRSAAAKWGRAREGISSLLDKMKPEKKDSVKMNMQDVDKELVRVLASKIDDAAAAPEVARQLTMLNQRRVNNDGASDVLDQLRDLREVVDDDVLSILRSSGDGLDKAFSIIDNTSAAMNEVRDAELGTSFLESVAELEPSDARVAAKHIDSVSLSYATGDADAKQYAVRLISKLVGDKAKAETLLDYYAPTNMNGFKMTMLESDIKATPEAPSSTVQTLDEALVADTGTVDGNDTDGSYETAGSDRQFEQDNDATVREDTERTYHFGGGKARRSFFVGKRGETVEKGMRKNISDINTEIKRLKGLYIDAKPVSMREYVEDVGGNPAEEVRHISDDIKKRLAEHKSKHERGIDRSEKIADLEGQLQLMRMAYKDGGYESVLELFEVPQETKERNDTVATDSELYRYADLLRKTSPENKAGIDETRITFMQRTQDRNGKEVIKPLTLSAESIYVGEERAGTESESSGTKRHRELFASGVAKIMNRPDIVGLKDGKLPKGLVIKRGKDNQPNTYVGEKNPKSEGQLKANAKYEAELAKANRGAPHQLKLLREMFGPARTELRKLMEGDLTDIGIEDIVGMESLQTALKEAETMADRWEKARIKYKGLAREAWSDYDPGAKNFKALAENRRAQAKADVVTSAEARHKRYANRFKDEVLDAMIEVMPSLAKEDPQAVENLNEEVTELARLIDRPNHMFNEMFRNAVREYNNTYDRDTTTEGMRASNDTRDAKKKRFYEEDTGEAIGYENRGGDKMYNEGVKRKKLPPKNKPEPKVTLNNKQRDIINSAFWNEKYPAFREAKEVINFAKKAKQYAQELRAMGDTISERDAGVRNVIENAFDRSSYAQFDWNSLLDGVPHTEADIKELEKAVEGKVRSVNKEKPPYQPGSKKNDPRWYKDPVKVHPADFDFRGGFVDGRFPKTRSADTVINFIGKGAAKLAELNRTDKLSPSQKELQKALTAHMKRSPEGWATFFPHIEFSKEDLAAIKAAKDVKQNAQTKKGKEDSVGIEAAVKEIRKTRGHDVKVKFDKLIKDLGGSGSYQGNRQDDVRIIRIARDSANPLSIARHESIHDFFEMLMEKPSHRSIKRDLVKASSSPQVVRKLKELLKNEPAALEQLKNPEERVAYAYQFWAEGHIKLGPKSDSIFRKILDFIRDVTGVVFDGDRGQILFEAFNEGKFAEPSNTDAVLSDLRGDTLRNKAERFAPEVVEAVRKAVQAAPDRLRDYQNDEINDLADDLDTFVRDRFQAQGKWENRLSAVLRGSTAVERKEALENMQSMFPPSTKLERELAKFLKDMHKYMKDAGVGTKDKKGNFSPIGYVNNYFPRAWDSSTIRKKAGLFKKRLAEHGGLDENAANKVIEALTHSGGQLDLAESEKSLGFSPFVAAAIGRKLTFIDEKNAMDFAEFQQKDMPDILMNYVHQAVHRAEYARKFGNEGEVIDGKIKKSGITDEKELKTIGGIVQAMEGTLNPGDWSATTKEVMSGILTAQNLILLPMALFAQMIDPVILAARTGDLRDAGNAYITALKRLRGKEVPGEDMARIIGSVSDETVLEAMGTSYGTSYMSKRFRTVNRAFFKYNGMQGWNNSMRIAATTAGERYLIAHRKDKKALAELGLTPSDIVVKNDKLDISGEKVQKAMYQFVDQAVLRPSASNRPVWMSDPRFILVGHLKQFTFAMHNVVLKRAYQQADDGNFRPAMILALTMPTILAADMAKYVLTGTPNMSNWAFMDFVKHAVDRSGLMGIGDFATQALKDPDYGKLPGESLLGPSVEHLLRIVRWIGGDRRVDFGNVVDRTIPGARYF